MKIISKFTIGIFALVLIVALLIFWTSRYDNSPSQIVKLKEFNSLDYQVNPCFAIASTFFQKYPHGKVKIDKVDGTKFDFTLEVAENANEQKPSTKIKLKGVDLSLFVTAIPQKFLEDENLTRIGLIDREWNRQQVKFYRQPLASKFGIAGTDSSQPLIIIEESGDGFEHDHLVRFDLIRNCLNAGLWEIALYSYEDGMMKPYYHAWFDFPLGIYKDLFEEVNKKSYWDYWWSLEHWVNPEGTFVDLDKLRSVKNESALKAHYNPDERIFTAGEQTRKQKNITSSDKYTWSDFFNYETSFSAFVQPGVYSIKHPWKTNLGIIANFQGVVLRTIEPRIIQAKKPPLYELELKYQDKKNQNPSRLIFGGIDLEAIKQLPVQAYDQGNLYLMGIATPTVFQDYTDLVKKSPITSPFYGVLLDSNDKWINHHEVGVDGISMHKDINDASLLHVYLISYERHTVLAHYILELSN